VRTPLDVSLRAQPLYTIAAVGEARYDYTAGTSVPVTENQRRNLAV
jgi:hypothetical protein